MKKLYVMFLLHICLILALNLAYAETREIIAEGTYIMGDGETPSVAQERAMLEAKRSAVEQAGTYLESFSEVKDMRLTKDEVRIIASGITETTIIDKKRELSGDALRFWVKVRCIVNTDNIQTIRAKLQDRAAIDTLMKVQIEYDNAMQEIAELKNKLAQAKNVQERREVERQIANNENIFTSAQWYERAQYQALEGNKYGAIASYTKAINLNPGNVDALFYRAGHYFSNRQYELAIADYDQIIAINPNHVEAFTVRANAYTQIGKYDQAIIDYDRALILNPQSEDTYFNRGNLFFAMNQYDKAIADYDKAININDHYVLPYFYKAQACEKLGREHEALDTYRAFVSHTARLEWLFGQQVQQAKQRIALLGNKLHTL